MSKQSHTFVMTTQVVGSAWDNLENQKNMKLVEKLEDKVWKDKETGKLKQGANPPFAKAVLVAGMGEPIPAELDKKALKKKIENKAVKKSEDK
jgi:hypothetical protein